MVRTKPSLAAPFQAPIAQQRQARSGLGPAHCTDLLSAKGEPGFLQCAEDAQKNCDKLLHCLKIDHGAPCPFLSCYQAVRLSAPRQFLRYYRSPQKTANRTKNQDKHDASQLPALDLAQLICRVFVDRRCSSCLLARSRAENAGAARGCAGRLQFGRGKATGRPVPIGRECPVLWIADAKSRRTSQNRRD